MLDFTTSDLLVLPNWLKAAFDESFPAEWMSLVRLCLKEIEVQFQKKHPEVIEVFFDEGRGKLRIHPVTSPPVPWMEALPLFQITKKYQALANDRLRSQGEITHESSSAEIERFSSTAQRDPGSPGTEESTNTDHEVNSQALELDEGIEDKVVDEKGGNRCLVQVFRGLYSFDDVSATRDDDTSRRLKNTMRRLRERGSNRPLQYPGPDWESLLDRLQLEFPNFRAVIQTIIRPHLGLLSRGHHHRMAPILLVGEPGIGKTQFARELKAILGVPALFLVMAEETNGSGLSGSSTFWANASPGKLFLVGAGGGDQITYNKATNGWYLADSRATADGKSCDSGSVGCVLTPKLIVVDGTSHAIVKKVDVGNNAHSVAVGGGFVFSPFNKPSATGGGIGYDLNGAGSGGILALPLSSL